MITLKHGTVSFAFPEISQQLRFLVDHHVQNVLFSYVLPANRQELVDEIGSMRPFWKLSKTAQASLVSKAYSLTRPKIEEFLRKVASAAAGLNNASPPRLKVEFQHPLRLATDFHDTLPASWLKQNALLMRMNPSDPFSIRFTANYPFALKLTVGNLDAMTGERSLPGLQKEPQNYFVVSGESAGQAVNERSFVLPLDFGCAGNELFVDQKIGRIDFQVWPVRVESYFSEEVRHSIPPTLREFFAWFVYGPSINARWKDMKRLDEQERSECLTDESGAVVLGRKYEAEFDPQLIEELSDLREVADWNQIRCECCSIHVCNSSIWQQITGRTPSKKQLSTEGQR